MAESTQADLIGRPLDRVDGALKVTGRATYPVFADWGVFGFAPVADQRVGRKGLHYTRCLGTVREVIRGGGCGGKLSLSCWIRSLSSGSGWV
jgi:hypothetical protein